jgi:hypothetical protein
VREPGDLIGVLIAIIITVVVFWLLSFVNTLLAALIALALFLFMIFGGGRSWFVSRLGGAGPRRSPR